MFISKRYVELLESENKELKEQVQRLFNLALAVNGVSERYLTEASNQDSVAFRKRVDWETARFEMEQEEVKSDESLRPQ